jgi:hypothetical protein
MTLLYNRSVQLQVCRFRIGCERTPIYDGPTSVAFNRSTYPN